MATTTAHPQPAELLRPAVSPSPPAPSVTPAQIAIVKATAPVLKEHGVTITTLFYKNMLEENPDLRNVFSLTSQATGAQPRALASAVLAYATYIEDLPKLEHAVERIAQKHASLFIKPEQYPIVGKFLMGAIGEVLGDAATPEIVDAWTAAYGVLADVFITREAQLYKDNENWSGWRKFKVIKRRPESANIESFYLAPLDGVALPRFLPGQYVSLQLFIPELGHLQSRQYSLSEAPRKEGDYYRISVKREDGEATGIPGRISNMLHDSFSVGAVVELSHPQGEFFLDPADQSKADVPLVLVSAGVGATPIMSILHSATQEASERPISWLHASRTRRMQPFTTEVQQIQQANTDRMASHVFLDEVTSEDREGVDFRFGGAPMNLELLDREKELFVSHPKTEYYICGPEPFMVNIRQRLEDMGIGRDRIHLELFATGDVA